MDEELDHLMKEGETMPSNRERSRLRSRLGRMLPHWVKRLLYPLVPWRSRRMSQNVSQVSTLQLAPHVHLDVCWVGPAAGPGPAASFYVHDDEVLRLDCFGGEAGHLHINMKQLRRIPNAGTPRFYLLPGSAREQVEQGVFLLRRNLDFCLRTNASSRVRAFRPEPEQLEEAAEFMRSRMHALLDANG